MNQLPRWQVKLIAPSESSLLDSSSFRLELELVKAVKVRMVDCGDG